MYNKRTGNLILCLIPPPYFALIIIILLDPTVEISSVLDYPLGEKNGFQMNLCL